MNVPVDENAAVAKGVKPASLRKRHEFLRLRAAPSWRTPAFLLVCGTQPTVESDELGGPDAPRVGYTVTKKMGNAVRRNRIKRRLRAAVHEERNLFRNGHDYILVARPVALTRPFADMRLDLRKALERVHGKLPD